ncbi:unnamed protein product [Dicrocoelium dendriticum]|nr:unnamed protein product [Dicrocoelium dendriticum]
MARVSLSDWMSTLPVEVLHQPLNFLAIPGSHDSFTYGITSKSKPSPDGDGYYITRLLPQFIIGPVLRSWSVTQNVDVADQLRGGIRYFDLRVCLRINRKGGKPVHEFFLVHGQFAVQVVELLKSISNYLHEHPREVVLLDCNHFYNFQSVAHILEFESMVVEVLGALLYPCQDDVPSLQSMWNHGRRILFFNHLSDSDREHFWPGHRMISLWPNTAHVGSMLHFLDYHYSEKSMRKRNSFYVFQGVLTPTPSYLCRHLYGGYRRLARMAGEAFEHWLQDPPRFAGPNGVNVAIIDFVISDFPGYAWQVIKLNYKTWVPTMYFLP